MKLHVNGKMAEREIDREIDRKKKEQESAEAISGLKNCKIVSDVKYDGCCHHQGRST